MLSKDTVDWVTFTTCWGSSTIKCHASKTPRVSSAKLQGPCTRQENQPLMTYPG